MTVHQHTIEGNSLNLTNITYTLIIYSFFPQSQNLTLQTAPQLAADREAWRSLFRALKAPLGAESMIEKKN